MTATFAVTDWSIKGDYDVVLAAMEVQMETVVNDRTFYLVSVAPRGNEFVGMLIYSAD